jgi:hypothetical protein
LSLLHKGQIPPSKGRRDGQKGDLHYRRCQRHRTALFFAEKGRLVGAYDIDEVGLESLAAELGKGGHVETLDVTQRADYRGAVKYRMARRNTDRDRLRPAPWRELSPV